MSNLQFRAASPDNKFDLQSIVDLFTECYGDSFPLSSVYDVQFWQQHIGQRFTSILVFRGRQLVGHLAAQPEGADGRMVQMLFPLCHPDAIDESDEILTLAWEAFKRQADRQEWHGIYFFAFAHIPEMVSFGERILQVRSTAICPGYFPASNLQLKGSRSDTARSKNASRKLLASERTDIIIGQRFFAPEKEKQRTIYCSLDHLDLVSKLYQSLHLSRDVKTKASREKLASYPLPADRGAIETRFFAKSGIMHAYIEPSLLASDTELIETLQHPRSESTCVFVKAYDPRALEVTNWLEDNGYEFSGILPFVHDRESLLFSHVSREGSTRMVDAETVLLSGFSSY